MPISYEQLMIFRLFTIANTITYTSLERKQLLKVVTEFAKYSLRITIYRFSQQALPNTK